MSTTRCGFGFIFLKKVFAVFDVAFLTPRTVHCFVASLIMSTTRGGFGFIFLKKVFAVFDVTF
jgi:hypothetical protein